MLLAKTKEKLFNRRNTVEIYELRDSAGNPIDVEKVVSDAEASSTIYKVNASVGEIPEELLNLMKVGDFVICSDKIVYQLIEKGDEALTLQGLSEEYISVCKYEISSEHWVVDESYQKPIINPEDASSGTIVDALGLDEDGKLVKGQAGGGAKLYAHNIYLRVGTSFYFYVNAILSIADPINTFDLFKANKDKLVAGQTLAYGRPYTTSPAPCYGLLYSGNVGTPPASGVALLPMRIDTSNNLAYIDVSSSVFAIKDSESSVLVNDTVTEL